MSKKYFCRNCKGLRNHKILFEVKKPGEEDYGSFQWTYQYKTIECLGCENISFLEIYGDSSMIRSDEYGEAEYYEDEEIFPYYLNSGTEIINKYHLPEKIRHIYTETINALKAKSLLLTAGGFRAVIEGRS